MKYIKPYQIFEASASPAALTQEQINWLDESSDVKWKLNPSTGLVDVDGNFHCTYEDLRDFKGVSFGKVFGDFDCSNNQLISLAGAPQWVDGYFSCGKNQLTSLVGAPQTIGGYFTCNNNQLTDLEGAPQKVGGDFWCAYNQLTTLKGAPQKIKGNFDCMKNQLKSLVGAPRTVGLDFRCYGNQITSLVGAPRKVGSDFSCNKNPISESSLKAIFALMVEGKSYQQALEQYWQKMPDEDKVLMYKQMPDLSPEDVRKYQALATYSNIKGYL